MFEIYENVLELENLNKSIRELGANIYFKQMPLKCVKMGNLFYEYEFNEYVAIEIVKKQLDDMVDLSDVPKKITLCWQQ